jgi:hypothetical protein
MARNRQLYRIALRGVRRINLSRRLVCWMDEIRMPRTALRIRYEISMCVCVFLDAMCAMCYQGTTCARVGHVCTRTFTQKFKN